MTCKLFADMERLKVREMEKKAEEKKRKAEETATDEVKSKTKKEWDQNYEVSYIKGIGGGGVGVIKFKQNSTIRFYHHLL